ncbi:MAG: cyclopropane fatty acyl phospholipid synthase [Candidatus Hydrogenedentes bacterium]|nr:cyclopropane fatty acyl phospholipid synthase [Candidatus Hydrogenedentota bacterium]
MGTGAGTQSKAAGAGGRHVQWAQDLLARAGVTINGSRPWDIQVHTPRVFRRVLVDGTLGLGEAYMDGWWDCAALDEFFHRVLDARLGEQVGGIRLIAEYARAWLTNVQRKSKAFEIGRRHYDLGNDLYQAMLDKRMVYTCAYWKTAGDLDQAQEDKLDLVCRKLMLRPGMKVLDIGSGWGSFAKFASETYGAEVAGITVSREQVALAEELCAGLPVTTRLQDYRDLGGETFDRVVSLGMIEHVGCKNYRRFMSIASECLRDDGMMMLQTIGTLKSTTCTDPWMGKYIFPNSMLPSLAQLTGAAEGLFVVEDIHNFGPDYDKTLLAWFANFEKNWPRLRDAYGERFCRMWKYYLLMSAGSFRARHNQLWQIVFSKRGVPGGYGPVR